MEKFFFQSSVWRVRVWLPVFWETSCTKLWEDLSFPYVIFYLISTIFNTISYPQLHCFPTFFPFYLFQRRNSQFSARLRRDNCLVIHSCRMDKGDEYYFIYKLSTNHSFLAPASNTFPKVTIVANFCGFYRVCHINGFVC